MATNKEVIQYYGRSSQTVRRDNLMTTEADDEPNNFHYFENLQPPKFLKKWENQLNIPFERSRDYTPGLMVCSNTVHRNESFVAKVSTPASLRQLPSPKSLKNKKRASNKRLLDNKELHFNAALSHLRSIKAKQVKFEWEPQMNVKCIDRKLNLESSAHQVLLTESEDPVEMAPLKVLESYTVPVQEEQITIPENSEIPLKKDEEFTFRPMLTFERKIQSSPSNGLFYFAEE